MQRPHSTHLIAAILLAVAFQAFPGATLAETGTPPTDAAKKPVLSARATGPTLCPDPASIPRTTAPADKVKLPILMYHHITHLAANANSTWRTLTVTPEAFEAQIRYLSEHGFHTIYFSDLIAYFQNGTPLPDKPVILTFDDGWLDDYTIAYPILKKYCMVGTFFPPVAWVKNSNGKQVITWAMIEEMSRDGMEIGSHTVNHYFLSALGEKQIMQQLVDSKAELERHVVRPVVVMAYPGGGYNALAKSLVPKAGYGAAAGITASPEQARSDLFLLHRITITYSDDLKRFEARIGNQDGAKANTRPLTVLRPDSMRWPDRWLDLLDR